MHIPNFDYGPRFADNVFSQVPIRNMLDTGFSLEMSECPTFHSVKSFQAGQNNVLKRFL